MPLIPLLLIRSCAIFNADLGAVPDLVPYVLRFELAAATAVAVVAIRGPAEEKILFVISLVCYEPPLFPLSAYHFFTSRSKES